ncbi:MAG: hypothetical protein V7641_1631 [Blastocatellia bacterium]
MNPHATSTSEHRSSLQWWLGALTFVAALVFGALGLWRYEQWQYEHAYGHEPDAVSIAYHTLQLFILHAPHLEGHVPWQLHVGRLLAAGLFFVAAGKAFVKIFRDELRLLRLWRPGQRGHLVVCGLGDLGLRLALEGRQRGFVVAIDQDPAPSALEQARRKGVLVLKGDARDPAQLRLARLGRAEFLVAVCGQDDTNVAIATLASQFAPRDQERSRPLVCRLLLHDRRLLRTLMSDEGIFNIGQNYRVNFGDLDLTDTAARQAFRRHPLDFKPIGKNDDTLVHLVVIGFGQIGQSMALHAARIGHFANEVGRDQKRLRITVVDDQRQEWNGFASQYPNLSEVCDADFAQHDLNEAGFVAAMAALCPQTDDYTALVTYVICVEHNDQTNLRLGLELSKQVANRTAQVLIHQTSRNGFTTLFPATGRLARQSQRTHVFGMKEDVFNWDVLLHESEDKLAEALHQDYQEKRAAENVQDNPGWKDLSEGFKESNRQAAAHIRVKLRALGYHDEPLTKEKVSIDRFEDNEVLLLGKLEHVRWCAERWLAGWTYGPDTDRSNKISSSLAPWEQLPPDMQRRDLEQIRAIPKVLARIGRGIYR